MVCEIKSCLICEKTATYCTIYIVMPAILDQPHTWARLNSWQKCQAAECGCGVHAWARGRKTGSKGKCLKFLKCNRSVNIVCGQHLTTPPPQPLNQITDSSFIHSLCHVDGSLHISWVCKRTAPRRPVRLRDNEKEHSSGLWLCTFNETY